MKPPRIAALAFLAATFAVHATLATLSPLLRDDWSALLWRTEHASRGAGHWFASFIGSHFTLGQLGTYMLATVPLLHTILTPLVVIAMFIGIIAIAQRRVPRFDTWSEVAMLASISAFYWIAQPHGGVAVCERNLVAQHLYGTALAVWLVAAYVCDWSLARGGRIALVVCALLVGIASRQVAVVTTLGAWWFVWRSPSDRRRPWMWWVAGTLLLGTLIGYLETPRFTIPRSDFDANLGVIFMAVREGGELVTLLLVLVFGKLLVDRYTKTESGEGFPDARESWRWLWIALVIDIIALPGPRFTEATLVPATAALCIAAAPYVAWLCRARVIRYAVYAIVGGTLAVTWIDGLQTVSTMHAEGEERLHRVTSAPAGSLPVVPPYSRMVTSYWFSGEDWGNSSVRERIAIELFHLQDVEFTTGFYTYERNPRLVLGLVTEGLASSTIPAPTRWASNVGVARQQFDVYIRDLEAAGHHGFSARLRVQDPIAGSNGRPLFAALYEKGTLVSPRVTRSNPDAGGTLRMKVQNEPSAFGERMAVNGDAVTALPPHEKSFKFVPPTVAREALLSCSATQCLVLDSFMPRSSAPE